MTVNQHQIPQRERRTHAPPHASGNIEASRGSTGATCEAVRLLTAEFFHVACERIGLRRDSRRMACHIRQIAMYVCHVSLQMTLTAIGAGFARDRSTVAHACAMVEDRRDNREFDEFVSALERIAALAFGNREVSPLD